MILHLKPVDKGPNVRGLNAHGDAKPELLARLGEFCSYCECPGSPQQLHVEHIFAKAETAHPNLSKNWRNFLLACSTCNTYKSHHLGNGRQVRLLSRFLWPHIDNTFNSFEYVSNGQVFPKPGLPAGTRALAKATVEMIGCMRSPAATVDYEALGIAYDGIKKREEAWGIAERARDAYRENSSSAQLATICDTCYKTGHFSVWMAVFGAFSEVRRALILKCKAAPACFDALTSALIKRGRS